MANIKIISLMQKNIFYAYAKKFRKMVGNTMFFVSLQRKSPGGEMVDALVSGASVERRVGSTPILGTEQD